METEGAKITEKWLREQWELCERATEGPWLDEISAVSATDGDELAKCWGNLAKGGSDCDNSAFIAAARTGYPLVLMELLRLREAEPTAECPCCGESFLERDLADGLCPECAKEEANG